MLYIVKQNETLSEIANKFDTTAQDILNANIICNENFISEGKPLVIPDTNRSGIEIPKSGAGPYYIVQSGDTLDCLSEQLGIPPQTLIEINTIIDPNILYAGSELILTHSLAENPEELKLLWENTPSEDCSVYGTADHEIYYLGSFQWVTFGEEAINPLLELLNHPCESVKASAIISLGRLGLNGRITQALVNFLRNDDHLSNLAEIALKRIELNSMGLERIHITMNDSHLSTDSGVVDVPAGSEIVVLKWFIPNLNEEGPQGGFHVDDYVQLVSTGQTGLFPRAGNAAITFI